MSAFTEEFESYWPDIDVTSLRRIQALYGAISEATEADTESVVPEEFQLYVTPGSLSGFTATDPDGPKLVTVLVDLTEEEPTLDDVAVEPLREERVPSLGFSRYPWGRAIDNSITRRGAKGGSSRSTVTTYCVECLERWTNGDGREPAVGEAASEHPDGWVIEALQELGGVDDIEDRIEDYLRPKYGEDESSRVVATVAVRVDADDLEYEPTGTPEDGYYYPGQLHILNAAMRARKEEKLAKKQTDVPSRGEAACMVTGEETDVFGTAEDPLALFTVQHAEKFFELRRENSWRAHPVSSEAALLIQSGSSLVESCRTTARGRSVYTIPYFVDMTPTRAYQLYDCLDETPIETQEAMAEVQNQLEHRYPENADALRFYVIALRNDSGDINVLEEAPETSLQPARTLAEAHMDVLNGSTFNSVAGFDQPSDWEPIHEGVRADDVVRSVVSGDYAFGTVELSDADDPTTDDSVDWLTFSLLAGEQIPISRLLEEYVARLARERRSDEENRLSENHLKAQFAQLEALATAGRLSVDIEGYEPKTTMTDRQDTDVPLVEEFTRDGSFPESIAPFREYRLERFLDERPSLADADSRRAAFLAGVLVGQVGSYQSSKRDMNRTVIAQYPAEQMTGDRIVRLVPELFDKIEAYAPGRSLFPELEDRLPDALSLAADDEWSIPLSDLRFHFALGQMYGKRATARAYDLRDRVANEADVDLPNTN